MIMAFGNSIEDSSEGGFCRYEGVGPSNAPGRDAGDNSDDSSDDGDDEEDHEEESDRTKTQEKGVVRED